MRFFVLIVQILRFPSLVPFLSLSGKIPRRNQRRTKEQPKNSKLQKVLFIKIAVSYTFLIPCPKTPRDDREKTERTPKYLPAYKSVVY